MFTATVLAPFAFLSVASRYSGMKKCDRSEEILDESIRTLMLPN